MYFAYTVSVRGKVCTVRTSLALNSPISVHSAVGYLHRQHTSHSQHNSTNSSPKLAPSSTALCSPPLPSHPFHTHPSPLTPPLSPLPSHFSPLTPPLSPLSSHPSPLTPSTLIPPLSPLPHSPLPSHPSPHPFHTHPSPLNPPTLTPPLSPLPSHPSHTHPSPLTPPTLTLSHLHLALPSLSPPTLPSLPTHPSLLYTPKSRGMDENSSKLAISIVCTATKSHISMTNLHQGGGAVDMTAM